MAVVDLTKLKLGKKDNTNMNTFKQDPTDLQKGFGIGGSMDRTQQMKDFSKTLNPEDSKMETQEYLQTGTFSKPFQDKFKNFVINQNDKQLGIGQVSPQPQEGIKLEVKTPTLPAPTPTPNVSTITPTGTSQITPTNTSTATTNQSVQPSAITSIDTLTKMSDEMGVPLNETTKKELIKNISQGNETIQDYLESYAVGAGNYAENKSYYTNFDEINNARGNILKDVTAQLKVNNGPLTDEQYQTIANKYGLTVDEVKNPNSLYKKLQMTEEGKNKTGFTSETQKISNLTTDFERKKQDINTNLERNLAQVDTQVSDIQKKAEQNVKLLESTFGFGTGGIVSTGFQQGINNIKQDTAQTVKKIQETANNLKTDTDTDLERLTQDYTQAYKTATDELAKGIDKLNQSMGIDLTGLSDTYGMGSQEMGKKLDEIAEKYNLNSQEIIGQYLNNVKAINGNIADSLDIKNKILQQQDIIANKRYNEYIANNGALLGNTSLSNLLSEYKSGTISAQRLMDLQNIMKNSIVSQLSQLGSVTNDDINTIESLLMTGRTPIEVISQMTGMSKFQKKSEEPKVVKIGADEYGNDVYGSYNPSTKQFEPIRVGGGTTQTSTPYFGDIKTNILDAISKAEGTHGNYNAMYGKGGQTEIDLTNKTLKEIQKIQRDNIYQDKNGNWVGGAIGKYQIVRGTLDGLIQRMGLTGDEKFTPELQDAMAMNLIGDSYDKYLSGEITPEQFQKKLAGVWAGIADPTTGQSVYASDKTNKATKAGQEMSSLLTSLVQKPENIGTQDIKNKQSGGKIFDDYENSIFSNFDGKDTIKLAKNLGTSVEDAKAKYNQWKQYNTLGTNEKLMLGSFLKDISGTSVSAAERQFYLDEFVRMKNDGLSVQEIKNQLGLYVPTDENKNNELVKSRLKDLQKYSTIVGVEGSKVIGNLINQGDYNSAVNEMENMLYKQKGIDPISIIDIGTTMKNGQDLKSLINKYESSFGPVTGWTNKQILKFKDDPATQSLISDMANFVAKYRNGIGGTSITQGETDFLQPLIAEITNNPKNALSKIDSIQKTLFNELNTTRDLAGLPKLEKYNSVYDINSRANRYKSYSKNYDKSYNPSGNTGTSQSNTIKSASGNTYTY